MEAMLRSLVLSIVVSVATTWLVRKLVATEAGADPERRRGRITEVVVIVPVMAGNSNNRIGVFHEKTRWPWK